MIKKQYLISLLGLAAVSIPLGTSLSAMPSNYSYETSPTTEGTTDWTIQNENEESEVVVFDTSAEADGVASEGDTLQKITVNAKHNKSGQYKIERKDSLYIYASGDITKDELLKEIEIPTLLVLEQTTYNEAEGEFDLQIDSSDDFTYMENLWTYQLDENSLSSFTINVGESSTIEDQSLIGEVEVNKTPYVIKSDTKLTINNPRTSWIDAEVMYKVDPGIDVYGNETTLTNIRWISYKYDDDNEQVIVDENPVEIIHDQNTSGALNETLTWSNLTSDKSYEQSIDDGPDGSQIIATMSNGEVLSEDVSFNTSKKDAPALDATSETIINVDENKEVIQVEGVITSNGSFIDEVNILDEKGNVLGTDPIKHNNKSLNYSVYTTDYNVENYKDYELEIVYKLDETTDAVSFDKDVSNLVINPEADLSYLLALGTGAIIGIILGALILFGILLWIGIVSFKKSKAKKA